MDFGVESGFSTDNQDEENNFENVADLLEETDFQIEEVDDLNYDVKRFKNQEQNLAKQISGNLEITLPGNQKFEKRSEWVKEESGIHSERPGRKSK